MEKSEDDTEREMEELNREIDEAEQEHQEPEPEPEPGSERVARSRRTKKVRSSAQIAAFEKARAKRAANILKRQQASFLNRQGDAAGSGDWQQRLWGSNYAKLLEVKKQRDPTGVFWCRHCIGDGEY